MGVSDEVLKRTIADFIEMGHIENIIAMFKEDTGYYRFSGDLIRDERYMVRMGMAVLFEELAQIRPQDLVLAIPYLLPLLDDEVAYVRGEAVTLLGIVNTEETRRHLEKMTGDDDPQVAEIARDILASP